MVGFDNLYGFILLLLIPLMYWHRRNRGKVKEVRVSLFPFLKSRWDKDVLPQKRSFRLSDRQRSFILAISIICIALSLNGSYLMWTGSQPQEWLFVLDNVPSISGRSDEGTVLSRVKEEFDTVLSKLNRQNRYTIMVTSPKPKLIGGLDYAQAIETMESIIPGRGYLRVDELGRFLRVVLDEKDFHKVFVVSPRSGLWRGIAEHLPIYVPPDDRVMTGNAGLTAVEVYPLGKQFFDLYVGVSSAEIRDDNLDLILRQSGYPDRKYAIDLQTDGRGEAYLPEIDLTGGEMTLALDLSDNLPDDNAIRIIPNNNGNKLTVELVGATRPSIEAAVSSYEDFHLSQDSEGFDGVPVRIYQGTAPEGPIDSPSLVIFPTNSFPGVKIKRIWTVPLETTFHPDHPATRYGAYYKNFRPAKVVELDVPGKFQVLADSQGIPLITSGTLDGHRIVIWGFDPQDNGLYLDPAFPVMLRDTILWLDERRLFSIDYPNCLTAPPSYGQRPLQEQDFGTLNCSEQVKEASVITFPELSAIWNKADTEGKTTRKDLSKGFLIFAILLIILLGLDRAAGIEREP